MWAFSASTRVRAAHYIGKGSRQGALLVMRVASCVCVGVAILVALLFVFGRSLIGKIISNDPRVWEMAEGISVLVGLGYVCLAAFYVSMALLAAQVRER